MKRIRTRRPATESTDIHGARKAGASGRGSEVEQHPDPSIPTRRTESPGDSAGRRAADDHPPYHPERVLLCPVCKVEMHLRYIGAVEIDQCEKCGGVFLDRGELKELTGREFSSYQAGGANRGTLIYTPHGLTNHVRDLG